MSYTLHPLSSAPTQVFALMVESLDDEHEVNVIRGVVNGAREAGATVICVAGGAVDDPDPDRRARNLVFDLISPKNVQGAVVMSSAIGAPQGTDNLKRWLQRFGELPICCVGIPVEGYPGVRVDNSTGMRALAEHLITHHDARRIGFINGPSASSECAERLAAFKAVLQERDLEFPDTWLVEGDFTKPSGAQAVRTLLGERRVAGLDAIVAANDFMALGAMEELSQRDIRVPEDMKVVGFDDVESAKLARPGLTTVRQSGVELGREGALLINKMLAGNSVPPITREQAVKLDTQLVVRESCGCLNLEGMLGADTLANSERGVEASFVQRRQIILAEVVRAGRGSFGAAGHGWESRLLDALIAELRGGEPGAFNRALHHILIRVEKSGVDGRVVQEMLTALRRQSLPCVAKDPEARNRLENAMHDARIFANTFAGQALAGRARAMGLRFREFRSAFRARMFGASSGLSRVLADHLPAIGVEACIVAALETPDEVDSGARMMFGFGPNGKLAGTDKFSMKSLPTAQLLGRSGRPLVLLPLVFDGQAIGATIMAIRILNGGILDELMELFGVAAKVRRALDLS